MDTTTIHLEMAIPFHFQSAAYSHGWANLAPNRWDSAEGSLSRVERLKDGQIVTLTMQSAGNDGSPQIRVRIDHIQRLSSENQEEIITSVGRMFRRGEDLQRFYQLCQTHGDPWRHLPAGTGRLLRSPTLFEDMVKTICTTNIQWAGTKSMVANLTHALGEPLPGRNDLKAFPVPEAIAAAPADVLAKARLGYRAGYISRLATRVVEGELNLEALEDPDLTTEELRRRLLEIKGIGNYAASTLLMLLGRYSYLAYDTVMRDFVGTKYYNGRQPTESQVRSIYESWGDWKYLAYWFDLIETDD